MSVATDSEVPLDDAVVDGQACDGESAADDANGAPAAPSKEPTSSLRSATLFGVAVVVVVVLAFVVGWFGFHAYRSHQAQDQRNQFLQVARQAALNLTTIDWTKADADVQRILDGSTGQFRDEFSGRSEPFIGLVKQAKSTTVGTISEAGVESETADTAQVLVAVTVKTSYVGAPEQDPRAWRMRIAVQRVGDQAKVSKVEFVP